VTPGFLTDFRIISKAVQEDTLAFVPVILILTTYWLQITKKWYQVECNHSWATRINDPSTIQFDSMSS